MNAKVTVNTGTFNANKHTEIQRCPVRLRGTTVGALVIAAHSSQDIDWLVDFETRSLVLRHSQRALVMMMRITLLQRKLFNCIVIKVRTLKRAALTCGSVVTASHRTSR